MVGRSRARTAIRWSGRALFALVLLAVLAVFSLLAAIRGSLPPLDGEARVDGLRAEVTLERDARGRVTVRARDRRDLVFGLGYAHGQDRFFQVDVLRRAGEGTLAALLGAPAVEIDRGSRRHDLAGTARAAFERASRRDRDLLESYARGVNAGRESLRVRPWEYLALRRAPDPFRPVDVFHVALAMYRDLQDETNQRELLRDRLARELRPEVFALLTAPSPWEAPLEGTVATEPVVSIPTDGPWRAGAENVGSTSTPVEADRSDRGSNSFAVGGAFTSDGRALLANDMHLGLNVPPIWYAVRLLETIESIDAVGVSLPGTPGLIVGSNGHLAWGFTNSYGDWLDHVVLELDPEDRRRYRAPGGWHRLRSRTEVIEVAGGAPVRFEVDHTLWGPVVGEDEEGRPLALRWVAQDAESLDLRLFEMIGLRDLEAALDLANDCGLPHQNFVVADGEGRVGWTIVGRVPRRVGFDGRRPRTWADPGIGWDGWLGPGEVPRRVIERDGRIWTANARVATPAEQEILGDGGYALGARAGRIRDRLLATDLHDEAGLFDVQLDVTSPLMQTWYERVVAVVASWDVPDEREGIETLLADWSGDAVRESVAYRLVRAYRLRVSGWILEALGAEGLPRTESAVMALLRGRPSWVPGEHDDWPALERDALRAVLSDGGGIEGWRDRTWGVRNTTRMGHLLSPALPDFLARRLDLPPREVDGDAFVPRVSSPTFGASDRLVVAPGREDRGILQIPGGANAHPFSPFRIGDYEEWVVGEPVPLLPGEPEHLRVLRPR